MIIVSLIYYLKHSHRISKQTFEKNTKESFFLQKISSRIQFHEIQQHDIKSNISENVCRIVIILHNQKVLQNQLHGSK